MPGRWHDEHLLRGSRACAAEHDRHERDAHHGRRAADFGTIPPGPTVAGIVVAGTTRRPSRFAARGRTPGRARAARAVRQTLPSTRSKIAHHESRNRVVLRRAPMTRHRGPGLRIDRIAATL
ncbi:MAG: hypothetical protein EBS51_03360 [Planctomycetia bacterium]|nr:hypothetical protein [Planctomycetia bacterium]